MCKTPILRNNLIAMCCLWAVSGFSFYLLEFYVKYFPGNVFFNKGFIGFCDALAVVYIQGVDSKFKKVPVVIRFTLMGAVFFSFLYMTLAPKYIILIPLLVGLTRMQINALLCYSYHVNQYLFPTLLRGAAYSMTNFVSRPVIGVGTFISEYTSNPMILVCGFSLLNLGSTLIIREPEDVEVDETIQGKGYAMLKSDSSMVGIEPPYSAPFMVSHSARQKRTDDSIAACDTGVPQSRVSATPLPNPPSWRHRSQRLMGSLLGTPERQERVGGSNNGKITDHNPTGINTD